MESASVSMLPSHWVASLTERQLTNYQRLIDHHREIGGAALAGGHGLSLTTGVPSTKTRDGVLVLVQSHDERCMSQVSRWEGLMSFSCVSQKKNTS